MFAVIVKFQFHKGTIKTLQMKLYAAYIQNFNSIKVRLKPQMKCLMSSCETFQFHKGTIKTNVCVFDGTASLHFNSIKVRLKHDDTSVVFLYSHHFNSIKVRLKRGGGILRCIFDLHFNSIKVRLKRFICSESFSFWKVFQFHKGTIKTWCQGCAAPWWDISIP